MCVCDSTVFLFFRGGTAQSCPPTLEEEEDGVVEVGERDQRSIMQNVGIKRKHAGALWCPPVNRAKEDHNTSPDHHHTLVSRAAPQQLVAYALITVC